MQSIWQAVEQYRHAQSELRAIGLPSTEQNIRWWLELPAIERRRWRGEDIAYGDVDGYSDGPPEIRSPRAAAHPGAAVQRRTEATGHGDGQASCGSA